MTHEGKCQARLQWILAQYPHGVYKVSMRNVPYLTMKKGDMEINVSWFKKSDMYRLFPDEGSKFDIKTKEEVVAFLKGEPDWEEYCHCQWCKKQYETRDEARACNCPQRPSKT